MRRNPSLLLLTLALAGCGGGSKPPVADFSKFATEFAYSTLGNSPVLATGVGYHQHNGVSLDEQLDDYSPAAMEKQRALAAEFRKRLDTFPADQMSTEERADRAIIEDQLALYLLEFDTIQSYRHNPTVYVELIGNALFTPLVLEYAPKADRLRHVIARLEKVPAVIAAARQNLVDSPEVWNRVAREENAGNIGLIDQTIRGQIPAELKAAFESAAAKALPALKDFNKWLETDLSKRTRDWRLGPDHYGRKLRPALGTEMSAADLLKDAETQLAAVRQSMYAIATKAGAPASSATELNQKVTAALKRIAQKHSTPDTYFADARRDLDEARAFVKARKLLTLPQRDNLQVIETPEFMRGIYGVGGFNSAPPLEPQLGAFYWLTPVPRTWPKERVESKLREYNFYGLKLLTIHEAMPGHYVQLEYSNDIADKTRRLLRSVFGSGPYVEGWAVYATGMMLDEGYLEGDPDLRMTFLKQQLRMIANSILDIRMQTMNMSDDEAMRLMLEDTFQEKEEATAKLQRAKLSSTQLPTYFTGYREWVKLHEAYKAKKGSTFSLAEFHERALRVGAVPMRALSRMLLE